MVRIESIAYVYVYTPVHGRLNRRSVEHLGSVLGQFERGSVGDVRDGMRRGHDLGIGRHDARHVGPDLQIPGASADRIEGCAVVGASASESGDMTVLVRSDEARCHEQSHVRLRNHREGHGGISRAFIHLSSAGLHQLSGIQPLRACPLARELPFYDDGRQNLAERLDTVAFIAFYFLENAHDQPLRVRPLASGEEPPGYPEMPLAQFRRQFLTVLRSGFAYGEQRVGTSAYGGAHQNHSVLLQGRLHYVHDGGDSRRVRDRAASELEYLHYILSIFAPSAPSLCSMFS